LVPSNALAKLFAGETPIGPKLINARYGVAASDYGFSVAGAYRPKDGQLLAVENSARSPSAISRALRE
jgi:sulfide dehydrogenase [flavocytochrome c] flavoprotein chain